MSFSIGLQRVSINQRVDLILLLSLCIRDDKESLAKHGLYCTAAAVGVSCISFSIRIIEDRHQDVDFSRLFNCRGQQCPTKHDWIECCVTWEYEECRDHRLRSSCLLRCCPGVCQSRVQHLHHCRHHRASHLRRRSGDSFGFYRPYPDNTSNQDLRFLWFKTDPSGMFPGYNASNSLSWMTAIRDELFIDAYKN